VQQQPVVGIGDIGFRDVFRQRHFHLIGGVVALAYESQSMRYPIDVGING
jgi:hypothetical protein